MLSFLIHFEVLPTPGKLNNKINIIFIRKKIFWPAKVRISIKVPGGPSGRALSLSWGHCIVFLGKTLYSHSASFHPGVKMSTDEVNAGGNIVMD